METLTLRKDVPLKPGFYPGVSPTVYHADPCPAPSLSSSISKILIDQSPRHAWDAHPRLNPRYVAYDAAKFDVGNAAHSILFTAGKKLKVIDAKDWRTNAAKADREAAVAGGFSPILAEQFEQATTLAEASRKQLAIISGCEDFFERDGLHIFNEVMIVWKDEGGIWCRSLIDRLCVSAEAITVFDLKTTGEVAAPHVVGRYQYNQHHDIQAAFYERGLQQLFSNPIADRLQINFIVQENSAPFQLTVNQIDLTIGRKMVSQAIHLWLKCTTENRWPGYPRQVLKQYMPGFMETAWLEREANDPSIRNFMDDPFLVGDRSQKSSTEDAKNLLAG